ncbi:hypothetical protein AM493_13570 [Flavobacterium akiainvivens]|uniref:Uncharacterized protein n=1 Tax=Flavobacterium akiainvivens TaxID=1202724 RepID=A0A0M9VIR3_9FLAO|nr:hypothetical protein [Flavobacterium akiainvivens]KOS06946.1 hypothetical protein AM493_13570 [Flavobacterium akiainvivens]SFQ60204.1 hypothetical protein SAMN05444144_109166 [Flavobacterium akiainvivens]
MKLLYFLLLPLLLAAQPKDSLPVKAFTFTRAHYKNFVIDKTGLVFAVTAGDSLIIWDIKEGSYSVEKGIAAVAKHASGNTVSVTTKGQIHFKGRVLDSVINAGSIRNLFMYKDMPVVITSRGVYYDGSRYYPEDQKALQEMTVRTQGKRHFLTGSLQYLDANGKLWFCYDRGEFGGGIAFFDLNTRKFTAADNLYFMYDDKYEDDESRNRNPGDAVLFAEFPEYVKITETDTLYKFPYDLYINHMKGIAEDGEGNFLLSESLMHFFLDGNITLLEKSIYDGFYKINRLKGLIGYETLTNDLGIHKITTEYIGPTAYNPFDNHFYYYGSDGFFRISKENEKYKKELLFKPSLMWDYGMPHAVGAQMNVTKFEFIAPGEVIFLTTNSGIGYYNGKQITYYR